MHTHKTTCLYLDDPDDEAETDENHHDGKTHQKVEEQAPGFSGTLLPL